MYRSIDFRLVLAKILHNMPILREWMQRMGKRPIFKNPEAFLFQPKIPIQNMLFYKFNLLCYFILETLEMSKKRKESLYRPYIPFRIY